MSQTYGQFPKRSFDIAISLCAISFLAPVFALIAIAIWIEDRGPIIFKQKRVGRNGKIFTVYKFRKFRSTDNKYNARPIKQYDQRYSNVGKFLEDSKLNEIPQFFNVIKGDMALVGPRPEVVEFLHCFKNQYEELLAFKPGIFGPSQTIYRMEATLYPESCDPANFYEDVLFPRKAEIDLNYYKSATNSSDLRWIILSLVSVFGFGQTTFAIGEEVEVIRGAD